MSCARIQDYVQETLSCVGLDGCVCYNLGAHDASRARTTVLAASSGVLRVRLRLLTRLVHLVLYSGASSRLRCRASTLAFSSPSTLVATALVAVLRPREVVLRRVEDRRAVSPRQGRWAVDMYPSGRTWTVRAVLAADLGSEKSTEMVW